MVEQSASTGFGANTDSMSITLCAVARGCEAMCDCNIYIELRRTISCRVCLLPRLASGWCSLAEYKWARSPVAARKQGDLVYEFENLERT
jgi:hypothetical protein